MKSNLNIKYNVGPIIIICTTLCKRIGYSQRQLIFSRLISRNLQTTAPAYVYLDVTSLLIYPIHAAVMMNKKRGLAGKFTANVRVSRAYVNSDVTSLLLHVPMT